MLEAVVVPDNLVILLAVELVDPVVEETEALDQMDQMQQARDQVVVVQVMLTQVEQDQMELL